MQFLTADYLYNGKFISKIITACYGYNATFGLLNFYVDCYNFAFIYVLVDKLSCNVGYIYGIGTVNRIKGVRYVS